MASEGEFDTEKVAVKTYVPAYQKERWAEHAEQLGMSQSEFVRTMVQAGRRDFEVAVEPASEDADPRGDALEDRVLDALESDGPLSFDELVDAVSDDLDRRVEESVEHLQSANRIKHSPRQGYALAEADR